MFEFKQFVVDDALCAMKVGTDAVLLGAWANIDGAHRILDVGTGSGIIALMAAQRNHNAYITAIDVVEDAVRQAQSNVDGSPWRERIAVRLGDIVDYKADSSFDAILSNPPYFLNSLHSPDEVRSIARHSSSLSYDDLVSVGCRMLSDGGRMCVILPTECAAQFRRVAYDRLWLSRLTDVVTRHGEPPRRTLMEFVRCDMPLMPRCDMLTIYGSSGEYTEEYRRLTQQFYIKF